MKKQLAETWQENETQIIIKSMNESLKLKDYEKVKELKRSLLNLERRSEHNEENKEGDEVSSISINSYNSPAPSLDKPSTRDTLREFPMLNEEHSKDQTNEFSPIENNYLEKVIQQNVRCQDLKLTIMLLGYKGAGKTTLMNAILNGKCQNDTQPTHGLDSKSGVHEISGKMVRFKIIDSDSDITKEFIRKGILKI